VAEHVAPILTGPQARALLGAVDDRLAEIVELRATEKPSAATREAAREQRALVGAAAALRRVIPDPAAPGTPTNEGTNP
jgi:hypothetical protein